MQVFFTQREVGLPHCLCAQALLVCAESFLAQDKFLRIESRGDCLFFKKYHISSYSRVSIAP